MKVFRTLHVRGAEIELEQMLARLDEMVAQQPGWRRDSEMEDRVRERTATDYRCYSMIAPGAERRVQVWVVEKRGQVEVANVVAEDRGNLSYDEYNQAVEAFCERGVKLAAAGMALDVALGAPTFSPRDRLGDDVAAVLEDFASRTNKATGASHPQDSELWRKFVITAHKAGADVTPGDWLARWLASDAGFPVEVAYELAVRYENERQLLRQFESNAA